jgi:hypothetical protein
MITVATLLWDANENSFPFSRAYDKSWVEKLYRGAERNLTQPFRFVCFTDQFRNFDPGLSIHQAQINQSPPDYSACIEPYGLGEPMILMGLDTVIVGNIDHLADYCKSADRIAVPRDPVNPHTVCNGVALVPKGFSRVATEHRGENDMDWIRQQKPEVIDDLWPGEVVSYRGHVMHNGLDGVRIVYFHGARKPHELPDQWVKEHWR